MTAPLRGPRWVITEPKGDFTTRLDEISWEAARLRDMAAALETEIQQAARQATRATSYWTALVNVRAVHWGMQKASAAAHEAGTDCAVEAAANALPADTSEDAFDALVEKIVNARKGPSPRPASADLPMRVPGGAA